jgi:hypothetical protein
MNGTLRGLILALVTGFAMAACRPGDEDAARAGDTGVRSDTMGGTVGMRGTGTPMMGAGMMDSMHVHMSVMDTMSADQMKAMLPMHRQMLANMLSQMNQEMRSMNMAADQAWTALADSLREDLRRMPEMSGQQLKAMMPAHHARVTRLMEMHRDMMGRMQH